MKTLFLALALTATAGLSFGQVGQDMKQAGADTRDAATTAGHKTKRGAKKAYHKSTHATRTGVHKGATATEKGADKVAAHTTGTSPQ